MERAPSGTYCQVIKPCLLSEVVLVPGFEYTFVVTSKKHPLIKMVTTYEIDCICTAIKEWDFSLTLVCHNLLGYI